MPLVRDPYEVMTIKLGKSSIPDSGEGIFAVRDIKAYELLALYNGYQLVGVAETSQHNVDCHNGTWPHNMTKRKQILSLISAFSVQSISFLKMQQAGEFLLTLHK